MGIAYCAGEGGYWGGLVWGAGVEASGDSMRRRYAGQRVWVWVSV